MGDMADFALEELMNWDEAVEQGYYDDPENWEDGMIHMFPFSHKNKQSKPSGPGKCPLCGAATKLKEGKFGKFYGCTKYPECRGNRNP
jgi:hypothetical protein